MAIRTPHEYTSRRDRRQAAPETTSREAEYIDRLSKSRTPVVVKLNCRDLTALVTADPCFIPQHFFESIAGNRTRRMKSLNACFKVEINEDFTDIK